MIFWTLVLIALRTIAIIDVTTGAIVDTALNHRRECITEEGLNEGFTSEDDFLDTLAIMFHWEYVLVPYEVKCFFRCVLKKTQILKNNFIINEKLNINTNCAAKAKALSNGNECDFAFAFVKCSPRIVFVKIEQTSRKENKQRRSKFLDTISALRTTCLQAEGLANYMFPPGQTRQIFAAAIQLKSEQVPYDSKCFLRCWLRKTGVLHDHFFIINKEEDEENVNYCQRVARSLSNVRWSTTSFIHFSYALFMNLSIQQFDDGKELIHFPRYCFNTIFSENSIRFQIAKM
uniref:Uncharacterized protein n=1 Tax=Glossina brevipalpis TaxID=37001 RepID=A0A1A9WXM2_9MUSC